MIDALEGFIPVTLNTAYTQWREDDRLRRFFLEVVDQAPWREEQDDTTQGMYVCASDGRLYGHTYDYEIESVLDLLRSGGEQAAARAPEKRRVVAGESPFEQAAPAETLLASVFARIDPVPEGAAPENSYLGRDHLWILREELAELRAGRFPPSLATRLARFHLWDNVRGEPDPWEPEHVRTSDFRAKRGAEAGSEVEIEGEFSMAAPAGRQGVNGRELPASGYEGKLFGVIAFDGEKVKRFVLYADGVAWGESTYTEHAPKGRFPLKVAFVLPSPDDPTRSVAPQGLSCDPDAYLGR